MSHHTKKQGATPARRTSAARVAGKSGKQARSTTGRAASGGIKPAVAFGLADLVEYAEGSIVSRTLVDKAQGTLTLFAFDKGQGLSEHTAPFDAYVLLVDGEAELKIAGKRVKPRAGQVVLMPAGVIHAVRALTPFKMLLIMIREGGRR